MPCSTLLALLLSGLVFILPARAEEVTVFAAASLKTALDEILEDQDVAISYAGSSTIARQIALGAPADIVLTANAAWMDYLEQNARIDPDSRIDLLGNTLVLIAPSDTVFIAQADRSVEAIIGDARIAMALTQAVPAGIYAKEALTSLGIWDGMAPNAVQTDNVRAALRLVAIGEVPFGIVYATDAKAEPRVQIVHRFDPSLHGPIVYPMARVAGQDSPSTLAVWQHLQSPEAGRVFAGQGFLLKDRAP